MNNQGISTFIIILIVAGIVVVSGGIWYLTQEPETVVTEEEPDTILEADELRIQGRDSRRVSDLRSIQSTLELYYGFYASYPTSLNELANEFPEFSMPTDPQINKFYEYEQLENGLNYELCAQMEAGEKECFYSTPPANEAGIDGFRITRPNDNEIFSLDSEVIIEWTAYPEFIDNLTSDEVVEIYLIKADGVIAGFIASSLYGVPGAWRDDSKSECDKSLLKKSGQISCIWNPQETSHQSGLDFATKPPEPGLYKILILSRHKREWEGGALDAFSTDYAKFSDNKILYIRNGEVRGEYELITSDVSDSDFILQTDWRAYQNKQYGFEFEYPKTENWRITEEARKEELLKLSLFNLETEIISFNIQLSVWNLADFDKMLYELHQPERGWYVYDHERRRLIGHIPGQEPREVSLDEIAEIHGNMPLIKTKDDLRVLVFQNAGISLTITDYWIFNEQKDLILSFKFNAEYDRDLFVDKDGLLSETLLTDEQKMIAEDRAEKIKETLSRILFTFRFLE